MPTYIGFSTVEANQPIQVTGGAISTAATTRKSKKFALYDEQLVIRDLINALSIQQGSKVGQPNYGTTLWTYLFEPVNENTEQLLTTEINRVIKSDPRIVLNSLTITSQDTGMLIQVEMAFSPFNNAVTIDFFLNRYDGSVQQLAQ
jgi:hypothetical protein